MSICFLALGSNLKTPKRQIRQAVQTLKQLPRTKLIQRADLYTSKAWGRKTQPDYCNTVIAVKTFLKPAHLLKKCQEIEIKLGRTRKHPWGSRTLDIDILLYGSLNYQKPTLQIPHPRMLQRDFMFVPLLEIAQDITLPDGRKLIHAISATPINTLLS